MRLVVQVAAALALVHTAVVAPLHAQVPPAVQETPFVQRGCGLRPDLARWLAENFAEMPMVRGLEANGNLFELFSEARGATWSAVLTTPAGLSCIVSGGTDLEPSRPPADGPRT
jgi:hypothetical protein